MLVDLLVDLLVFVFFVDVADFFFNLPLDELFVVKFEITELLL